MEQQGDFRDRNYETQQEYFGNKTLAQKQVESCGGDFRDRPMECYACKYEGQFATLSMHSSDGWASVIGRIFGKHVGSVDLHACPHCGAVHSDFRGQIAFQDRGGKGEG